MQEFSEVFSKNNGNMNSEISVRTVIDESNFASLFINYKNLMYMKSPHLDTENLRMFIYIYI